MMIRSAAAALCASLLLVGCSADADDPEPLPPVESASPSPVALPVPSEAAAETPQGAAAFAEYFFEVVVNEAYASRDSSRVVELSAASCNSCQNIIDDVERLAASELTIDGRRFKIAFAEAPPANPDGSIFVDFRFSSDPYVERNEAGDLVRQEPAQIDQDAQVKLVRRGSTWVVDAIRTV